MIEELKIVYTNGKSDHLYDLVNVSVNNKEMTLIHDIDDEHIKEFISLDVVKSYTVTQTFVVKK